LHHLQGLEDRLLCVGDTYEFKANPGAVTIGVTSRMTNPAQQVDGYRYADRRLYLYLDLSAHHVARDETDELEPNTEHGDIDDETVLPLGTIEPNDFVFSDPPCVLPGDPTPTFHEHSLSSLAPPRCDQSIFIRRRSPPGGSSVATRLNLSLDRSIDN
jgi:hypothetical protein